MKNSAQQHVTANGLIAESIDQITLRMPRTGQNLKPEAPVQLRIFNNFVAGRNRRKNIFIVDFSAQLVEIGRGEAVTRHHIHHALNAFCMMDNFVGIALGQIDGCASFPCQARGLTPVINVAVGNKDVAQLIEGDFVLQL